MPVPVKGPLYIYISPSSINSSSITITVDSSFDTFNSSISGEYLLLETHGYYNWNDTHTVGVSCDGYLTTSGTTDGNGKVYITLTTVQYVSKLSNGNTTYTIKDREARTALSGKQDTLVSGTNIKTVGGTTILGSGNIPFPTVEQTYNALSTNAMSGVAVANAIDSRIQIVNSAEYANITPAANVIYFITD